MHKLIRTIGSTVSDPGTRMETTINRLGTQSYCVHRTTYNIFTHFFFLTTVQHTQNTCSIILPHNPRLQLHAGLYSCCKSFLRCVLKYLFSSLHNDDQYFAFQVRNVAKCIHIDHQVIINGFSWIINRSTEKLEAVQTFCNI